MNTFIAIPCHNGDIKVGLSLALCQAASTNKVTIVPRVHSALTRNFNELLCQAINEKFTHFCMVHSDVVPQGDWLTQMHKDMAMTDADILSATIAIKGSGSTSTGVFEGESVNCYSMKDLMSVQVFADPNIALNTGLMLIKLSDKFISSVIDGLHFRVIDNIRVRGGRLCAEGMSEDWDFSREARKRGLKLFATNNIKINHIGETNFLN